MKKILSVILIFCIILSTSVFVSAEEVVQKKTKYIYVDPTADEGGIGTKERPFRTIFEARDMLRMRLPILSLPEGGICVILAEGEYRFDESFNFISDDSGKDGRYVTYKGEGDVYFIGGGEGTVLNGSIINAENVNYLAFENIKFKNNVNAPLLNVSGNNISVKNCTFSDSSVLPTNTETASGYAFSVIGDGVSVEDCEFYNVEGAVYINGGEEISGESSKVRIVNSYIHDTGLSGITDIPAIRIIGGCADIDHNEITEVGSEAIVFSGDSYSITYNKIISADTENANDAIKVEGGFLSYGNVFEHNFIDSFGGIGINLPQGVSGAKVNGNVIKDTYLGVYLGGGRNFEINGNIVVFTGTKDAGGILYDNSFRDTILEQYESQASENSGENGHDESFAEKIAALSQKYPELYELCYSFDNEEKPPLSDPSWYFNPAESEVSNNAFYVEKKSPALSVVTEGITADGMAYHIRYGAFYANAMMPRGDFSDFPKMMWNNFDLGENAVIFSVLPDFKEIAFEEIGRFGQKPVMYFTDITPNDWFYTSVSYAFDNALMSGTNADGTVFSPYTVTTRAMLVQMLYNLEGMPEVAYSGIFTDVKETDWCAPAVMWAYENGITTGTGDGRFDPNASVTREQIAVFLYRFISEYKGEAQKISGTLDTFNDKDDVSPYDGFAEAVTWAVDKGIIGGKNEFGVIRLAPRDVAQRCETAAVIARFHEGFVK